jgi:hypothetical protein
VQIVDCRLVMEAKYAAKGDFDQGPPAPFPAINDSTI